MKISCVTLLALVVFAPGCTIFSSNTPKTKAEEESGYTYIPLDPFPVTQKKDKCSGEKSNATRLATVLESLPDNAARISVTEIKQNGEVSFSAGGVTEKGSVYRVTIDYTNSATVQVPLWIKKEARSYDYEKKLFGNWEQIDPTEPAVGPYAIGTQRYKVSRQSAEGYRKFNVPVYVGIGLRVISQVSASEGKVSIAGLGAIAAGVEANHLAGTLLVQTLGVNGKAVSAAMPIHSELNRTTVQSSIVAVGSIKTLLYGRDVNVQPRIVGIYLPLPADQRLVNAVLSAIFDDAEPVPFVRPCVSKTGDDDGTEAGPLNVPS